MKTWMKNTVAVIASVVALGVFSLRAQAQEAMLPYPNLSGQGPLGNPARFNALGDFAYVSTEVGNGAAPSNFAQLSLNVKGVQAMGALGSDKFRMINASFPLNDNLVVGATFTNANPDGIVGAVYTIADSAKRIDVASQINGANGSLKHSFDIRMRLGDFVPAFSGQITAKGSTVLDKGLGIGLEYGRVRGWAGAGGKDWKDIQVAAQIRAGKGVLPDVTISIPQGNFRNVRCAIGVTKVL